MITKAIEKIQTEMSATESGSIKRIGEYLLEHLTNNPQDAEKINAEGRTIARCLDAIRDEAVKQQKGNYAVLTDEEGFAVVRRYYVLTEAVYASSFDANLDDLLK